MFDRERFTPAKDIIVGCARDSHNGVWRDAGALLAWAL